MKGYVYTPQTSHQLHAVGTRDIPTILFQLHVSLFKTLLILKIVHIFCNNCDSGNPSTLIMIPYVVFILLNRSSFDLKHKL